MDDGEKYGVFIRVLAFGIGAVAEDEAERISCLMPCSSFLHRIRLLGVIFDEAGKFERIREICSGEAIAE